MSAKTEKPTDKKKQDSAKKGNSLKSKDLTTNIVIFVGICALSKVIAFDDFIALYSDALLNTNNLMVGDYTIKLLMIFLKISLPFIALCGFAGLFISMLQTKFTIAVDAIRLNFQALNPAEGIKKLFSLRTIKELVKSILYLILFSWVTYSVFYSQIRRVLSVSDGGISSLIHIWVSVGVYAALTFNLWSISILVLDFASEYLLHNNDLKMEKHEVKQEHKENEGNPEIKGARRKAHREILTGEEKAAIRNSEVVMANPTHIAIAIYFNPEVAPLPFITLRCTNQKARAVIAYAEKIGIPVVRHIRLTRRLYKEYKQHNFIGLNDDSLMEVMDVLIWLKQVESINTNPSLANHDHDNDEGELIAAVTENTQDKQ